MNIYVLQEARPKFLGSTFKYMVPGHLKNPGEFPGTFKERPSKRGRTR